MFKPLANGLTLLETLGRAHSPLSTTELSDLSGLSRSSVRRLVQTLNDLGYVKFDGRTATATAKCLLLASTRVSHADLVQRAEPTMNALSIALNETVSLAVLEGFKSVYLARVKAPDRLQYNVEVGARLPAHCCSTGRVLLAAQPASFINAYFHFVTPERYTEFTLTDPADLRRAIAEADANRLAEVQGEMEDSIYGVAVPIVTEHGQVAALGVTSSRGRATEEMRRKFAAALRGGALRISTS